MYRKNRYKIAIIGGGMSGCVSAFLLSKLGHDISLFEKKNKLGGTIKDIIDKKEIYLNGPQYFDTNTNWYKEIQKIKTFKKNFYFFNGNGLSRGKKINIFKSFNDLFGDDVANDLFAQPITNQRFKGIKRKKKITFLIERLSQYQNNVRKPIINWCKNFLKNFQYIHENCSAVLSITRIFFQNDKKKIKDLKTNNKNADNLLGLPVISQNKKFCIPKKGFDNFFYKFEKILKKSINLKLNSNVKIYKSKNSDYTLNVNSKNIKVDKIVWACNPIPLMNSLGYGSFDNLIIRVKIYCAKIKFKKKYDLENFYIQIFSKKTNIFRIYIYKLNGKFKIAIETFIKKDVDKIDKEYIYKILKKFKINIIILGNFVEQKEIRHVLITKSDYDKFKKFEKEHYNSKLVSGGWHIFGRDQKIDHIMSKF